VDDRGQKVRLSIRAVTGKGAYIAAIDGVNDRNLAERWRGRRFLLPRSVLPPAEDGEFYVDDLIGLAVYNQAGKEVGTVRLVADFGAGDVVEITFHNGTDGMFAFTHAIFPEVSLAEGRVTFVPPPEEEAKP
jgi:16S rRNA processing protein RimM